MTVVLVLASVISGCAFLGWLLRGSAGRVAITRAATTESLASSTIARSALAQVAVRAGLSVTEALAMRGASAGLARTFPVRLGTTEILPLDIYEGSRLVLRGELRRSGSSVVLSDQGGGSITARYVSNNAIELARGTRVIGRGVEETSQLRFTSAQGLSFGRDVLANGGRTIRHLDHRGSLIAETSLESQGPTNARRIVLRVAREVAEDIRGDLMNESGYADEPAPHQLPSKVQLTPISMRRRANYGLLQTNIYWTASFQIVNTGASAIGVHVLGAATTPVDCFPTHEMQFSDARGVAYSTYGFRSTPTMSQIPSGRALQVELELACDSPSRSISPVATAPLTLEILVEEQGLIRTISLGANFALGSQGEGLIKGPSQVSGPLRITSLQASRRSYTALLQGNVAWHMTLLLENTTDQVLFVGHELINGLRTTSLDCVSEPQLNAAWGLDRQTDFEPRPSSETRQSMLSIAPGAQAQVALEFSCSSHARNLTPQAATSLSGRLLIEQDTRFESLPVNLDIIPISTGRI